MRPLLLAVALLVVAVSPAWAGGWAVTTLDSMPDEIRADAAYQVGYTIRQHGQTPFDNAKTSIEVTSPGGQILRFEARPSGPAGHYVAEVRFPAAGTFGWKVNQDWFGVQELGTVTVLPAAVGGSAATIPVLAPAPADAALSRLALPLAAGGALVLFGLKLVAVARRIAPVGARGGR